MIKLVLCVSLLMFSNFVNAFDQTPQNNAGCMPFEKLEFQGKKTPALIEGVTENGQALGHLYVTYLRGRCQVPGSDKFKGLLVKDPAQIEKLILGQLLGGRFRSLTFNTQICTASSCETLFTGQLTTAPQDGWTFDLREVIEVKQTQNSINVHISSQNYGGRNDIVGHGMGSSIVKKFDTHYQLELNPVAFNHAYVAMTVESLSLSNISNGAERLVLKFHHSNIEHKAINKFNSKLDELFHRLTGFMVPTGLSR